MARLWPGRPRKRIYLVVPAGIEPAMGLRVGRHVDGQPLISIHFASLRCVVAAIPSAGLATNIVGAQHIHESRNSQGGRVGYANVASKLSPTNRIPNFVAVPPLYAMKFGNPLLRIGTYTDDD